MQRLTQCILINIGIEAGPAGPVLARPLFLAI